MEHRAESWKHIKARLNQLFIVDGVKVDVAVGVS
jgi:hypothetical protein